ncbi:hypothetical protein Desgi_3326 [Desulfoscipio gibsoniae DSM 7213]|uniref:Uncharacterized protein n=1 Tax=Desulfoscipio gibsoniae DSM 7213 TaxID=767817 RepID=R4KM90_9FIRM|nr:hypothetical protein Desgi_3326 [Desulfoscipio gibsoniae DSM 7213]
MGWVKKMVFPTPHGFYKLQRDAKNMTLQGLDKI